MTGLRRIHPLVRAASAIRPRSASVLVALVCAGAAVAYALSQQTPVGRVEGQVLLSETQAPIGDARITLFPVGDDEDRRSVRSTRSDKAGHFKLLRVAGGAYHAVAETPAHSTRRIGFVVVEGETTSLALALTRSRPDLDVVERPHNFLISEGLRLPIRGYVDGSKPAGKDAVHARLFRAQVSSVIQQPQASDALSRLADSARSRLPEVLLSPPGGEPAQLVVERDFPITEGDPEGFFTKDLPFPISAPGLYLMEAAHSDHYVATWALVTDTALVMKRVGRQLAAYTVDMRTGRALADSAVRVYVDGWPVAVGMTNVEGFAELTLPEAVQNNTPVVTLAARGPDETFVGRTEDEFEESGQFAVFLYTDRPLYRPGHLISYKGIVRRAITPGVTYAVPQDEPISVELRDPTGERVLRETRRTSASGSFAGSVTLSPEAATGTYTLVATVRGEKHTQDVVISAYRKPEFAVTVTPAKARYARGEKIQMTIAGEYYFGAPVSGARVRYTVFRVPDWASAFSPDDGYNPDEDNLPGFGSGGTYGAAYGETVSEGETRLDGNGKAVITFQADVPDDADGPPGHIITASVEISDASGRSVSGEGNVRVTQGDLRLTAGPLGYVASPGQPATVLVRAQDFDRRPVKGLRVELETGYLRWNHEARTLDYRRAQTLSAVTGDDGTVAVALTPPTVGELRVTATARDARARVMRARTWLWVTDDRGGDLGTEYAGLSLLTDKRRYQAGETVRALLNTEDTGQTAFLSIEGDRLYRMIAVPITQHSTIVRVPVPADFGPNVYLVASYVRNKKLVQSSIPLRVSVPARDLSVSIRSDRPAYEPGDPITYEIQTTDAQGHPVPAELSFGVVDESIYALAEDDPMALRDAFYPRRVNAVRTRASFAVEYLGDTNKSGAEIVARKLFPDTAYWAPVVQTSQEGRATIHFTLPDSLTTWRATAVGHTPATALGRSTQKVTVAKPFFVRLELPRFLTQGDRARILALLHNQTGSAQAASVQIQADGLKVEGADTQTVDLRPGQIREVAWQVTAPEIAPATVRVAARTSGGGPRQYTDGVELPLTIRPHGREEIDGAAGEVTPAGPSTTGVRLDPAAIPGTSGLTIRITPSVSMALVGALEYLVGFPYGCTEQTMSRFYPDALVQHLLTTGGGEKLKADLPRMIRDGLARLYRFQHESGAWGWWEHDSDSPWMTAYVLVGFSTAAADGYPINEGVLKKAQAAARRLAWAGHGDDKAFLAYALALSGGPASLVRDQRQSLDLEDLERLRQSLELERLGPQGLAYTVLLDRLLGGTGEPAYARLMAQARAKDGTLSWSAARGEEFFDWDARMTTASALRAMLAVNPNDPRINAVVRWLMLRRTGAYWESTRDTAWVLAALADYLNHHPENGAPGGSVLVRLNGQPLQTIGLTPEVVREPEIVLRVPGTSLQPGMNAVTLERVNGASTIFYSAQLRQTVVLDRSPTGSARGSPTGSARGSPTGSARGSAVPASGGGTTVKREYLRVVPGKRGDSAWSLLAEPTNNLLRAGDWIRVRLTVTVPREMAYVLIEDPFPAGAEVTERASAEEVTDWNYWWSSVDVRDDRITFFARRLPPGTHVIEYNLRALTPGRYHALPTLVQEMYAPAMRSASAEAQVDVR